MIHPFPALHSLLLPLVLIGATAGSLFAQAASNSPITEAPSQEKKPLVIWPLGDSITQGAGFAGGYRAPLLRHLTKQGYNVRFAGSYDNNATPELSASGNSLHDGHGSYPTMFLLGNLDGTVPVAPAPDTSNGGFWLTGTGERAPIDPDLVLLMAGTNDLGMFGRSPDETLATYALLLDRIFTLRPKATVICATLVPYNGAANVKGRDYSRREAKQLEFNAGLAELVARQKATGRRIFLCDMRKEFPVSRAAALLTKDGVHPNQAGYEVIAGGWLETIREAVPRG